MLKDLAILHWNDMRLNGITRTEGKILPVQKDIMLSILKEAGPADEAPLIEEELDL
jgi:hypothetical protein